ncbi:TRAP transporter small permease [Acuticoccus kandeliae]|uniref:TRAP transporter small permease n=1 Tax=Acuticoccus kandeliae TaxID=2073160 RepID=UPI000D3E80FC|nr:TRAP transporter small permease [Acuticoccus kandeliae]
MKALAKIAAGLEDLVAAILLVGGLGVYLFGALMRYVFNAPIEWGEEAALLLVVWGVMIGFAIGVREGSHISLHVLYDALNARGRRILDIVASVIGAGCGLFLVYGGVELVRVNHKLGRAALGTGLPMWLVYAIIPVSGALILLHFMLNAVSAAGGKQ